MNFEVHWTLQSQRQLAWAYNLAKRNGLADRVPRSTNEVDLALSCDPMECSESREGPIRILIRSPLTIYFVINEKHHSAYIGQVRLHEV